ncbi:hypothetical protein KBI5_15795 [Frankia sp. KB5]|nr:hypothetical protein KBI5_15795 [Frankia sp. KB5]
MSVGNAARPEDLVTFGDIREALGVTRQRASVIVGERRFPAPWFVSRDGTTRLWLRAEVETWLDANRPDWRG